MNKLLLIILSLVVIILVGACDKDDNIPRPTKIKIVGVSMERVSDLNGQSMSWDEDNSGPDVFVRFSKNNGSFLDMTDTIVNYSGDFEANFILSEDIILTNIDTSLLIDVVDHDFIPGLPVQLQSDERIFRIVTNPWEEPSSFIESGVVRIRGSFGVILFDVDFE